METLQAQLDAVVNQIANETDPTVLAGLEQRRAVLTMQIEDAKTQEVATQERIQAQVEKVESITLPYNFSEIFDDPRADLMIVELIKEYQRTAYADHNAEVETLVAENKSQVAELKVKNDELQATLQQTIVSYKEEEASRREEYNDFTDELKAENTRLRNDWRDAESKRDAAVREKEGLEVLLAEKQAHIDKLREEIAIGAKAAVNVTNISPSDRLAALVQESKSAKVKSALDIALENATPFRGPVIKDGQVVVAPLIAPEVPTFQTVNQTSDTSNQLVTGPTFELPTVDQAVDFRPEEVHSEPITVATGQPETSTEAITTDYIEQRLAKFATEHGLVKQGV